MWQVPLDAGLLESAETREVSCWDWKGSALDQGDEAAKWLTDFIGRCVRLVRYAGELALDVPALQL